ncbi:MAG: mandelate racemase/muconate lactonizing enzyme family protein [Spirochaetales bacterium]|jgi:L-Ala-D/L-Glu epimerase|nr:mandelate racemase/muconate lactonizing enzyme family protein [Spirochaetales bacterium]
MKITDVRAVPVRMPVNESPYPRNSYTKYLPDQTGRRSPKRPDPILEYVLVYIESDEGITGVGESQADIGFFGQTVEEVFYCVRDYFGPNLIGLDPFDREHITGALNWRGNSCARAGIDVALLDLMGKVTGQPIGSLIGGIHHDRLPVSKEIAPGSPDDMAAFCVELMERQNIKAFKAKIGGNPEADARRLKVMRQAVGPEVSLRADANQGYRTAKDAIRFCHLCEKFDVGLELLEQPVAYQNLKGMALVRSSVNTLIEADEGCYTLQDAMLLIQNDAVDVLNIKIGKAGGITNAKKIAAVAEAAGLNTVVGTALGLGPERAAKLHLSASTPTMLSHVEFSELTLHSPLLVDEDERRYSAPIDEDGCLPVPTKPGLGVTVDEEKVAAHRLAIG